MDCLVNVPESTTIEGDEEVTFLYRLCDGSSPRSYGINVARLAKLPQEVIELAYKQSREFEEKMAGDKSTQMNRILIMNQFYERLVSVLNSKMEKEEIYWVTAELWKRYSHIRTRVIE